MKDKDETIQNEVQQLVVLIVNAFVSNDLRSDETEKLPSSQDDNDSYKTAQDMTASTTTVRINDDHPAQDNEDGNYF